MHVIFWAIDISNVISYNSASELWASCLAYRHRIRAHVPFFPVTVFRLISEGVVIWSFHRFLLIWSHFHWRHSLNHIFRALYQQSKCYLQQSELKTWQSDSVYHIYDSLESALPYFNNMNSASTQGRTVGILVYALFVPRQLLSIVSSRYH